ncbi:MAG: Ig-like domain-containing protein [Eubacterium sp.]|nr:Ig-like domain-containing protein [Eubacterium sp.]
MRKSFKKVLCAVMAASMVFSTPIATNVVAQAASGEEGACVVKDLTKTTELTDTVANGAWWTNFSDYYRFKGNFDCTLELTSKSSAGNNYNAPNVVLTTDANRADTENGYKEYVVVRADNFGWGDNWGKTTASSDSYDWPAWVKLAADCKASIQIKRAGSTVYVNETYTSATDASQVRHQSYTVKDVTADTIRFFIAGDTNEMNITKAIIPEYIVKAAAKLDLATNGTTTGTVGASVEKNNGDAVEGATVTYATSNDKVATVDDKGTVTAVGNGSATITSTYTYDTDKTVTSETEVNVTTNAEKVTISGEGVENGKGTLNMLKSKKDGSIAPGSVALTATVTPENASQKDIEWSVNGTAVTVDDKGVVTTADDAKDGDKATVTATVKGTDVSASVEFTVGVKEVEELVQPASIVVSPAAVTANAGEEVKFTAKVYGEDGKTPAANEGVTWSAADASGSAISVSKDGVLTVPADVKEGDKITVTATSKVDGKVIGTATITVHLYETVTGTVWWQAFQASKDRILKGDGSVSFLLENNAGDVNGNIGFCVEAYAVNADGTKYETKETIATAEKGAYITSSYNGQFGGWVAGIPAAKLGASDSVDFAANSDNFYNISASKEAFLPEHTYKVTFTKKGNEYLVLMKDMDANTWFYRQIFKGVDMESDTLGIHFMAQLGTFNLVDTDEHLTTDTTNKPQVVRPGQNNGNNNNNNNNGGSTPSPSPSPSNNNTNKNNSTTNNNKTTTSTGAKSTVKAAKITVKKGKKAVSKVTVKKGKKVTLKVSVNSKGKLSVAKLSKKAKKIATVTLKKGKVTIKGKKKGKVTLKIKAAKTSKYKKATKSIKVTVK